MAASPRRSTSSSTSRSRQDSSPTPRQKCLGFFFVRAAAGNTALSRKAVNTALSWTSPSSPPGCKHSIRKPAYWKHSIIVGDLRGPSEDPYITLFNPDSLLKADRRCQSPQCYHSFYFFFLTSIGKLCPQGRLPHSPHLRSPFPRDAGLHRVTSGTAQFIAPAITGRKTLDLRARKT